MMSMMNRRIISAQVTWTNSCTYPTLPHLHVHIPTSSPEYFLPPEIPHSECQLKPKHFLNIWCLQIPVHELDLFQNYFSFYLNWQLVRAHVGHDLFWICGLIMWLAWGEPFWNSIYADRGLDSGWRLQYYLLGIAGSTSLVQFTSFQPTYQEDCSEHKRTYWAHPT